MPEDRSASEFSQSLRKLGLTNKADRVEETGRKSAQRDGNDDKWWLWVPWESGIRTSRGTADRKAREQFDKAKHISALVGETFGTMTLLFPLSLDPKRGTEKMNIFTIRSMIRRLIRNGGYKIGTMRDYIAFKVISIEPFDSDTPTLIESSLPRNARIEWSNQPRCNFEACLRRMLAPDLPTHDNDRARLEYVLGSIKQVAFFGTAYGDFGIRDKVLYQNPRNPLKIKERPRNPKTDAIATCYVPPKAKEIPFDEIDPFAWRQYIDYVEVDATTPAEHAAMLEPHSPHPPNDDSREHERHETERRAEV